jgi:hypothetical protein
MLSMSFLPTSCVDYQDESWPEVHPNNSSLYLYKVKVTRDHCMTASSSLENFLIVIK